MSTNITAAESVVMVMPRREAASITLRRDVLRVVRSYSALVVGLGTAIGVTVGVTVSSALGWW